MIETLQAIVESANVERLNLSIQTVSESRTAVIVQAILRPEPDKASDDQRRLRKALASPIMVEGLTGEVDAKLDSILTKYVESVRLPMQTLVTNVDKVAEDVAEAQKPTSEAAPDGEKSDTGTADSSDKPAEETPSVDALASGDADSL